MVIPIISKIANIHFQQPTRNISTWTIAHMIFCSVLILIIISVMRFAPCQQKTPRRWIIPRSVNIFP